MKCSHIDQIDSNQATHILPCRDELCMKCIYQIKGLFEGEVFSCPFCGNFSQYVDTMIESLRADNDVMHTKSTNETAGQPLAGALSGDECNQGYSERSNWDRELRQPNPTSTNKPYHNKGSQYAASTSAYNENPTDERKGDYRNPLSPTPRNSLGGMDHQKQVNAYQSEDQCAMDTATSGTFDNKSSDGVYAHLTNDVCTAPRHDLTGHPYHNEDSPMIMNEDQMKQQVELLHDFEQNKQVREGKSSDGVYTHLTNNVCTAPKHDLTGHPYHKEDSPMIMNEDQMKQQVELLHDFEQNKQVREGTKSCEDEDNVSRNRYSRPDEVKNTHSNQDSNYNNSEAEIKVDNRFCKDHIRSEVFFFCKTCDRPVCGKCTTTNHQGHIWYKLDANEHENEDKMRCKMHKYSFNMFCEQCTTLVCRTCKEESHNFHRVVSIRIAQDNIITTFQKYLDYIRKSTDLYNEQSSSIEQQKNDILRQSKELKQRVEEETKRAHKEIDDIAAEQMTKIEKKVDTCIRTRQQFSEKIAEVGKRLAEVKASIANAELLLSENDLPTACIAAGTVKENIEILHKMKFTRPSGEFNLALRSNRISRFEHSAPLYVYEKPSHYSMHMSAGSYIPLWGYFH